MEVLLVLVLLGVIVAAAVYQFAGWAQSQKLIEGARRMEAVLRMSRAEAANRQLRLQLSFDPQSGDLIILWEPKPLDNPGQFEPYTSSNWDTDVPRDLVRINRCELTGPSAFATLAMDTSQAPAQAENPMQTVTFYPDGHCDSATLEVISVDPADTRVAVLEMDGFNGTVTTTVLDAADLDDFRKAHDPNAGGSP